MAEWNDKLRNYLREHDLTAVQFTRILNAEQEDQIPYPTVKGWVNGSVRLLSRISPNRVTRLYDVTMLDDFAPEEEKAREEKLLLVRKIGDLESAVRALRVEMAQGVRDYANLRGNIPEDERVGGVAELFYLLIEELNYFKREERQDAREKLRRAISAGDVGYLGAFLNAIFQPEDIFRSWLFNARYRPRRGGEDA